MTTAKPGAMSLLDKYATINASIEDARRRVASSRAEVVAINAKIEDLHESRAEMVQQTADANADVSKLTIELEKISSEQREKIAEKNRVERENKLAKCVCNDTKNRIENERVEFLDRCREFRASCKRIRAAASILVLEGGVGNFDARDATDEIDLWRRLQEEDYLSDSTEEGRGTSSSTARKREHKNKKIDSELEKAEKEEKTSRRNHIDAECKLHTTRSEHEEATKRSRDRRKKLTQQRTQLDRHRKEVEELEREINRVKDEAVEANQLATTYEKECQRRKQIRQTNAQASYSNFNPTQQESTIASNPYRRNSRTTTTAMPVSNPYKAITPNTTTNSTASNPYHSRNGNVGLSSSHRYASELMNEVTPQQYGDNRNTQRPNHHQQGSRTSRLNRQFGTNVGVSTDAEMTDELRECLAVFSTDNNNPDDHSVSSDSSSDDEILSFNMFGKK